MVHLKPNQHSSPAPPPKKCCFKETQNTSVLLSKVKYKILILRVTFVKRNTVCTFYQNLITKLLNVNVGRKIKNQAHTVNKGLTSTYLSRLMWYCSSPLKLKTLTNRPVSTSSLGSIQQTIISKFWTIISINNDSKNLIFKVHFIKIQPKILTSGTLQKANRLIRVDEHLIFRCSMRHCRIERLKNKQICCSIKSKPILELTLSSPGSAG